VLVCNLAPGATGRLGSAPMNSPALPRLIAAEISGYGVGGPLEGKRAYDMWSGGDRGLRDHRPARRAGQTRTPFADGVTGLYAALASWPRCRNATSPVSVRRSRWPVRAMMNDWVSADLDAYTGVDQQPVGMGSPAAVP